MKRRLVELALVALTIGTWPAGEASANDLKFISSTELAGPGVDVLVINGTVADPTQWPATFVFRTTGGGCTATAVGPKALLTAAHCVENGQQGQLQSGPVTTAVTCSHHPDYPRRISADFALCKLEKPLATPKLGFETLASGPTVPKLNDQIVLLGFGCREKGGTDQQFGVLFQGNALISGLPSANDWYFVSSGAALCYGDSGGGVFTKATPGRRVFGVNSRGDISTNSWLSSTSEASFRSWASSWSNQNGAEICGLGAGSALCRQ